MMFGVDNWIHWLTELALPLFSEPASKLSDMAVSHTQCYIACICCISAAMAGCGSSVSSRVDSGPKVMGQLLIINGNGGREMIIPGPLGVCYDTQACMLVHVQLTPDV